MQVLQTEKVQIQCAMGSDSRAEMDRGEHGSFECGLGVDNRLMRAEKEYEKGIRKLTQHTAECDP